MCQDFEELLASFNAAGVRYLVGGAHALALYARPRATKDLDLFVDGTKANARRVLSALADFFGASVPSYVTMDALLDPDIILQLGVAPIRVDILSGFATLSFQKAWSARVDVKFGRVPAHFLSRDHLIAEKLHYDRPQDRVDVALLRQAAERSGRARD